MRERKYSMKRKKGQYQTYIDSFPGKLGTSLLEENN